MTFLRDVRQRIREVTGRDYINTAQGTLDYVLVFIPNEQVYGFIHEHDATIADSALEKRVVLCSPLTLFAVLAVIRQSVESVRLEERAHEILGALGAFEREWGKYHEAVLKLGRGLTTTQRAYEDLSGHAYASNGAPGSTRWNNCGRGPGSRRARSRRAATSRRRSGPASTRRGASLGRLAAPALRKADPNDRRRPQLRFDQTTRGVGAGEADLAAGADGPHAGPHRGAQPAA